MASLTGNLVAETYKALLKTIDNDILTASEKQITDGLGGGSNVFIDSNGFLRANKYKVTNGLATQFLKADGSLDANTYLTSITGAQVITALGYTPVTDQRTLTINGVTYNLTANRSWTVAGTAAVWGNITGTLSNQTDLQAALNAKFNIPAGTISQYIRGDGSLATFPTLPGGLPIGGTAGQILSKIDATDYNTHWIDNFATQTKNEVKLGGTLAKGAAVYVSSANGTNIVVSAASNTSEALSSKTFGLLETGGATNAFVKCVTFGLLAGLDTSTAAAGDPVWLGVNGALIFGLVNKPYAPKHLVYIGVVTRVNANNGEIFVNVQNGFELKEIHDVYIVDPANNHGLFYDIADGLWKNKSIATALGYTPQAQLSGTGFVKVSGTTISYDNSTYLTTGDAASTYQRLDKMVSNLLPSATEYPNSNAVIAALALKANAANPVFTGNMTISGAEPKLFFTDTDNNPDYTIFIDSGIFYIYDQTAGATRFSIGSTGNISAGVGKSITAGSFVKESGTAAQFLKADGSIDSSTYVASSALANYLLISTAASTYQRLDKMVSNLLPSSTEYPNSNAVINALALKADAANPVFTGDLSISGATPRLYFVDTDQNPDYTVFIDSGYFYIYDQTAGATRFSINSSGNINTGVGKSITAGSFIKESGIASQYLMADGSVSTGPSLAGYVPYTGATANVNLGTYGLTASTLTDGIITISSAQINRLDGFVEMQFTGAQGVKIFGNTAYPIIFTSGTGAATFSSTIRSNATNGFGIGSIPGYRRIQYDSANNRFGLLTNADELANLEANAATFLGSVTATSLTINGGTTSSFVSTIQSLSTFTFGSTNGRRIAVINTTVGDQPGLQFGYDATDNTGIVAGSTQATGSGIDFYTYNGSAWASRVRVSKNGNLLIGITTDSGYKLDVNGTGIFRNNLSTFSPGSGINSATFYSRTGAVGAEVDQYGGLNAYSGILNSNGNYGSGSSGTALVFNAGAVEQFRIQGTNMTVVGSIGTTALNMNNMPSLGSVGGGAIYLPYTAVIMFRTTDGATARAKIQADNSNNLLLNSDNGGNIAIGTTSTNAVKVQILQSVSGNPTLGTAAGNLMLSQNGLWGMFFGLNGSTGNGWIQQMRADSATAYHLMLQPVGGNVLIGTTTDNGYKLNVNGTIRVLNSSLGISIDGGSGTLDRGVITTHVNRLEQLALVRASVGTFAVHITSGGTAILSGQDTNTNILSMVLASGASTFVSSVTATSFFESSDLRLKTLIESNPIIDGIEKLEAKLYEKNGKIELGYFAQHAELIMPYAVQKNSDGFLNLSYREVHTAKIARLEKEVAELKAQLNLN